LLALEQEVEISTKTSLLEAAEEMGIQLPFECRSGVCGQCKTKLLKGRVVMETEEDITLAEKSKGFVLAKICRPSNDQS